MAERETKNNLKDLIEAVPEELSKLDVEKEISESLGETPAKKEPEREKVLDSWIPKTKLGDLVKHGKETNFDKLLEFGKKIIEPEIADKLLSLKSDLLLIGQAKGKFGGGKRRAWRQTQKKTME